MLAALQGGPTVADGPAAWGLLVLGFLTGISVFVKFALPVLLGARKAGGDGGGGGSNGAARALSERLAGAGEATMLNEVKENRRGLDQVRDIVERMADAVESNNQVMARFAALAERQDARIVNIEELAESSNRMLGLHAGLLEDSAKKVDVMFARTADTAAANAVVLKKGKRKPTKRRKP